MRSSLLALLLPAVASARFVETNEPNRINPYPSSLEAPKEHLIELSPGETRWVTEEQKWELRRVSVPLVLMMIAALNCRCHMQRCQQ